MNHSGKRALVIAHEPDKIRGRRMCIPYARPENDIMDDTADHDITFRLKQIEESGQGVQYRHRHRLLKRDQARSIADIGAVVACPSTSGAVILSLIIRKTS